MTTTGILLIILIPLGAVTLIAATLTALTIRDHHRAKHTNHKLNGDQK